MGRTSIAPLRISATLACAVALGIAADPVSAQKLPALRAPQIQVNNGTLQGYLNGVGESINVETDQRDVQLLDAAVSNNSTFTLQFEFAGPPGNTLGIYNGHVVAGTLMPMFPAAATNGGSPSPAGAVPQSASSSAYSTPMPRSWARRHSWAPTATRSGSIARRRMPRTSLKIH